MIRNVNIKLQLTKTWDPSLYLTCSETAPRIALEVTMKVSSA